MCYIMVSERKIRSAEATRRRQTKKSVKNDRIFCTGRRFFTNTWNENPGYIYAAGGVLLAVILAIIIGCAVSKRKKKAAAAKNEEPAETSAAVREEEVSGAPRAVETTAQPAAETAARKTPPLQTNPR